MGKELSSGENPAIGEGREDAPLGAQGGKFLTFFLGAEEYGLEILRVFEIIGMLSITPVPRTPAFIRGVVNLRGKVIPVVDLRLKFGMEPIRDTEETCIIVVQFRGAEMGIVVDRVSEVLTIPAAQIDEPPAFGPDINTDYILGIGKTEGKVKLILDIQRVLAAQGTVDIGLAEGTEARQPGAETLAA